MCPSNTNVNQWGPNIACVGITIQWINGPIWRNMFWLFQNYMSWLLRWTIGSFYFEYTYNIITWSISNIYLTPNASHYMLSFAPHQTFNVYYHCEFVIITWMGYGQVDCRPNDNTIKIDQSFTTSKSDNN